MKLSLAQYVVARADTERNLATIEAFAAEAAANESNLLCLPEMCTTGFDWAYNRSRLEAAYLDIAAVGSIARTQGIAICGSFLEQTEAGRAANCFYYFDAAGREQARYRKMHRFTLFHEDRHVEAGNQSVTFATEYGQIGAAICYDLRFPELFRRLTAEGAWLQILPAAFPHPRLEHWRTLVRARAIENQVFVVAVNQCGVEEHSGTVGQTCYFGHSMVVDPQGIILVEADEAPSLSEVRIDPTEVEQARSKLGAWADRRTDVYGDAKK